MSPKHKSFSQLGAERQRLVAKTVSDILEQHCPSLDEAHLLPNKAFSRCQSVLPGLSAAISGAQSVCRARALSRGAAKKRRQLRHLRASSVAASSSASSSSSTSSSSTARCCLETLRFLQVKVAARKLGLWPGTKNVQRKVCVSRFIPRKQNCARVSKT